jgi:Uma2 family endonuclease
MTMLHPTPQSYRPTAYQPPTTPPVVTVRPPSSRPAPAKRKRVSEAEYWETYYVNTHEDRQYEWNNGYLEEKPMPDYVSYSMYQWLVKLLDSFLEVQPLAKLIGLEVGFRLFLPQKTAIRKPDLGVVLNSNPVPLGPRDQSYHGIFDICLESLSYSSPSEIKRDTVTKKLEYAQAGVKEYYILDARDAGAETAFYQLTPGGVYVPIPPTSDGLIGSNVLPGFQFRLPDLQRRPTLGKLSEDPVYQAFVGLDRQAERRARQLAESHALAERDARQVAEAHAQAERDARQQAEAQAQADRDALQLAEAKIQQLVAQLAQRSAP